MNPVSFFLKNMKTTIATAIIAAGFLFLASPVYGAGSSTNCQPIYGGGQTCVQTGNIVVDKKVSHPQNGSFVDNLGVNDPKFAPDQTVAFQITITNNGGSDLSKVSIKDIFPQYVSFVSGVGNYDANAKTLSFDIANLKAKEARTFTLSGKVAGANSLPENVVCVVNQAQASADNQNAADNAQFCIQKQAVQPAQPGQPESQVPATTKGGLKVFPPAQVKTTPATGPEAAILFGLVPTGILGHFLRKRSLN